MSTQQTRQYRQGLVRITGQSIIYDWRIPFNKKLGTSIGSGFFINQEGHFLTSAHVVDSADQVMVEIPFESKKKFKTEVIGICFELDIALLKVVDHKPKYFFKLGDSHQVQIGDQVSAVGFPLGKDEISLTQGVISGRESGVLQTDTALNPGNSGGPLLKNGNVMGINFSVMAGASGVGFAIPINHYYLIEDELKSNGSRNIVRRPVIGIEFNPVNPALLELEKSPCGEGAGVYISLVYPGSPSEKAGLKEGHILCSINNKKIDRHATVQSDFNPEERVPLGEISFSLKNNATVPMSFWNENNQLIKTNFKAEAYELPIRKKFPRYEKVDYEIFAGIIVMELALNHLGVFPRKLSKFRLPKNRLQPKLILTKVLPGSEIDQLDIFNDGDLITAVNDQKVNTLEEYRSAMQKTLRINGKQFIKIVNEDNRAMVLNLEDVLKQELELSTSMDYKPSKLTQIFSQKLGKMPTPTPLLLPKAGQLESRAGKSFDEATTIIMVAPISQKIDEHKAPNLGEFNYPPKMQGGGACQCELL